MKFNSKKSILFLLSLFTFSCFSAFACNEEELLHLFSNRFSGYSYDESRNVEHDQVHTILSAGRLAPSSYNEQPWRFIICEKRLNPQAYEKALACLVEENREWAKNAPVLIICLASTKSAHNGKNNDWAKYDLGAASISLMLQATSMGLMAHQMGGFDPTKVVEEFSIPDDVVPMSIMSIGYSNGEVKPKNRKPLSENFFAGEWSLGFE